MRLCAGNKIADIFTVLEILYVTLIVGVLCRKTSDDDPDR